MPSPYSEDLRDRVLKAVSEKTMTIKKISQVFKVSIKTIYLWRKRKEETGSIKPYSGYQKGYGHKIKDIDRFTKFLNENLDITIEKIIEAFGNMCKNTVYNYLNKVNYTYKKTFLYQERDEEKRGEFIKKVAEINEESLVFIDESGIEDNEFYAYGWSLKGKRLFADKPGFKRKSKHNWSAK